MELFDYHFYPHVIIVLFVFPGVQNRCNVHIRFPERAAVNGTENGDHPTTNGDSPTPPAENEDGVKKCDIIQITGKVEQVELGKQALLVSEAFWDLLNKFFQFSILVLKEASCPFE